MAQKAGASDGELLGRLVNLGARGPPRCGDCLLESLGGLHKLAGTSPASLSRLGLTPSQTAAVLAAVEIARRLARAAIPDRDRQYPSPDLLARYLALQYGGCGQEVMGAFFLNARGNVLGEEWIFRGTLHRCCVEPGPVLKAAALYGASEIILWHTHPSGDPRPSREDTAFTRRMARACELMAVRLIDHLVVGFGGAWVSMRQEAGW